MDHLLSKEYIRDEIFSKNSTGHFVVELERLFVSLLLQIDVTVLLLSCHYSVVKVHNQDYPGSYRKMMKGVVKLGNKNHPSNWVVFVIIRTKQQAKLKLVYII